MSKKSKRIELQERDESVLVACRDLTILSPDQLRRLHWSEAGRETARKRLLLPDSPTLRQMRHRSGLPVLPNALPVFRPTASPKNRQAVARYRQQQRTWQLCYLNQQRSAKQLLE